MLTNAAAETPSAAPPDPSSNLSKEDDAWLSSPPASNMLASTVTAVRGLHAVKSANPTAQTTITRQYRYTMNPLPVESMPTQSSIGSNSTSVPSANTTAVHYSSGDYIGLFFAIKEADLAALHSVLDAPGGRDAIRYIDAPSGLTALHYAVRHRPLRVPETAAIVKLLIEHGAVANEQNAKTGKRPLHYILRDPLPPKKDDVVAKSNVDNDATALSSPTTPASGNKVESTESNLSALKIMVMNVVRILLNAGADPNEMDGSGNKPLNYACKLGIPEIVDMLINAGANPNAVSRRGKHLINESTSESVREVLSRAITKLGNGSESGQPHFALVSRSKTTALPLVHVKATSGVVASRSVTISATHNKSLASPTPQAETGESQVSVDYQDDMATTSVPLKPTNTQTNEVLQLAISDRDERNGAVHSNNARVEPPQTPPSNQLKPNQMNNQQLAMQQLSSIVSPSARTIYSPDSVGVFSNMPILPVPMSPEHSSLSSSAVAAVATAAEPGLTAIVSQTPSGRQIIENKPTPSMTCDTGESHVQSPDTIEQLQKLLDEANTRCNSLQSQLDQMVTQDSQRTTSFQDQIHRLEHDLSVSETRRDEAVNESVSLAQGLASAHDRAESLQTKLDSVMVAYHKSLDMSQKLANTVDERNEHIDSLQREINAYRLSSSDAIMHAVTHDDTVTNTEKMAMLDMRLDIARFTLESICDDIDDVEENLSHVRDRRAVLLSSAGRVDVMPLESDEDLLAQFDVMMEQLQCHIERGRQKRDLVQAAFAAVLRERAAVQESMEDGASAKLAGAAAAPLPNHGGSSSSSGGHSGDHKHSMSSAGTWRSYRHYPSRQRQHATDRGNRFQSFQDLVDSVKIYYTHEKHASQDDMHGQATIPGDNADASVSSTVAFATPLVTGNDTGNGNVGKSNTSGGSGSSNNTTVDKTSRLSNVSVSSSDSHAESCGPGRAHIAFSAHAAIALTRSLQIASTSLTTSRTDTQSYETDLDTTLVCWLLDATLHRMRILTRALSRHKDEHEAMKKRLEVTQVKLQESTRHLRSAKHELMDLAGKYRRFESEMKSAEARLGAISHERVVEVRAVREIVGVLVGHAHTPHAPEGSTSLALTGDRDVLRVHDVDDDAVSIQEHEGLVGSMKQLIRKVDATLLARMSPSLDEPLGPAMATVRAVAAAEPAALTQYDDLHRYASQALVVAGLSINRLKAYFDILGDLVLRLKIENEITRSAEIRTQPPAPPPPLLIDALHRPNRSHTSSQDSLLMRHRRSYSANHLFIQTGSSSQLPPPSTLAGFLRKASNTVHGYASGSTDMRFGHRRARSSNDQPPFTSSTATNSHNSSVILHESMSDTDHHDKTDVKHSPIDTRKPFKGDIAVNVSPISVAPDSSVWSEYMSQSSLAGPAMTFPVVEKLDQQESEIDDHVDSKQC